MTSDETRMAAQWISAAQAEIASRLDLLDQLACAAQEHADRVAKLSGFIDAELRRAAERGDLAELHALFNDTPETKS